MRTLPLLLMLIIGIAVGVWIGRMSVEEPAPTPSAADASRDQPVVMFDTQKPAQSAAPAEQRAATVFPPPPVAQQPVPGVAPPPARPPNDYPPAATSGYVQPIDPGPVFRQQFENAEREGHRDGMLEAHRALERELRDDGWAYPMEADIENTLIPETSMGNFRREHVECRATKCEIRLSAEGATQVEALRQWTSDIQRLPWASSMALSSASTISSDDRMDTLMILEKPPAPAQPQ